MKPYITVGWVFIHGKFHFVSADKYLMRYHEIIAENAGTLTLWHGGRDLESSYHEVRSHAKGRWEHGPGLYLTTHYDTAAKYAKGGGKLYKVTVRKGTDISEVEISFNDAMDFVNSNVKGSKRKQMETDLANNMSRRNAKSIPAEVMINLCLNCEAIPNTKTNVLRQFLIDQGVDYAWVNRYGGRNESVMVVINPKIITRVQVVPAKDVKDGFELPNTFQESLNEGRDAPLYHSMTGEKTIFVFENDIMPARWEHQIPKIGKVKGNSFSRNKSLNFGSRPVRLIVDQNKLAQTNKIIPLDGELVFNYEYGNIHDRRVNRRDGALAEEFVIGDIKHFHRCLIRIELANPDNMYLTPYMADHILEVAENYCKKFGIEFAPHPRFLEFVSEAKARWEDEDED